MIKVPLSLAYIKRTLKPLYANTQATPQSTFLDPAWNNSTLDIYPGMALVKTTGNQVSVIGSDVQVYGLANFYEAPIYGIKEITDQGINATSVWVLGPDSQFQVSAPAFDSTLAWADGDLVFARVSGTGRGQLVRTGATNAGTKPLARVISVDSTTQLTIGGLYGTV
jgi:hypothetical protein